MTDSQHIRFELQDLGLDRHEADSFLALLTKSVVSWEKRAEVLGDFIDRVEKLDDRKIHVETMRGLDNINRYFCRLMHDAEKEVLVFVRPPYACKDLKGVSKQIQEYKTFMKRRGSLRWVFEIDSPGQAELVMAMVEPIKNRAEVRVAKKLPMKLMVFDDREILVLYEEVMSSSRELKMTWIKHQAVARAFRSIFMFIFDQSLDYVTWKREEMESKRVFIRPDIGKQKSAGGDGTRPMQTDF